MVSLNDKSQLARRRQQSVGSAFQFHYSTVLPDLVLCSVSFCGDESGVDGDEDKGVGV